MASSEWPEAIRSVEELDDLLSRPTPAAVRALAGLKGDLIILGVGGKMGPTLARMARRATDAAGVSRRIIGVSRFAGSPALREQLQAHGIETIAGDLLDPEFVAALPDVPNVIFMAGMKFGATGNEPLTWAENTYLPSLVCRKFRRSRIAAFSTGNVYGNVPVARGGSVETDVPNPCGEYAMSCLGRERIFEYFSRKDGIPTAIIRLNYAVEMRYGVLVDLAQKVYAGLPIDLAMGYANVIWQGDAAAMTLCALADAAVPPLFLNVTGPERLSVRDLGERFGRLMGKPVRFTGSEAADALLSNAAEAVRRYGPPAVGLDLMMQWIARWIAAGGPTLGKPTHFEVRDGKF
jgi:nucleoside-diphosphate-sugar epimerase